MLVNYVAINLSWRFAIKMAFQIKNIFRCSNHLCKSKCYRIYRATPPIEGLKGNHHWFGLDNELRIYWFCLMVNENVVPFKRQRKQMLKWFSGRFNFRVWKLIKEIEWHISKHYRELHWNQTQTQRKLETVWKHGEIAHQTFWQFVCLSSLDFSDFSLRVWNFNEMQSKTTKDTIIQQRSSERKLQFSRRKFSFLFAHILALSRESDAGVLSLLMS